MSTLLQIGAKETANIWRAFLKNAVVKIYLQLQCGHILTFTPLDLS